MQKFGDTVTLKFSDGEEVEADIEYIKEEDDGRILVFKITENVGDLIEYRKVSFEIIWWSYSGWKVSNSALIEEDDLTYIKLMKSGVEEKVLVKVLRQNSTYSIVSNYSDDELLNLGYSLDEIQNMSSINLYDQIIISSD